ncbi:MAG: hypothetical protein SGPRY_012367 [Prymnesium sp.]
MADCQELRSEYSHFYQKAVEPMLQDVDTAGELVKTRLTMRGGDEEVEVDGTDEALQYVQMDISKVVFYNTEAADVAASALQYVQMDISTVVFYTEAADVAASTPLTMKAIADVLQRQPAVQLPHWSHTGRPEMTCCSPKFASSWRQRSSALLDLFT